MFIYKQSSMDTNAKPILTGKAFLSEIMRNLFRDSSAWSLLISNLVVAFVAIQGQWGLRTILLIYLVQSIIIGLFSVLNILSLKQFSTDGLKIDGKVVPATRGGKLQAVSIFVFTYGFFHVGYATLIMSGGIGTGNDDIDLRHIAYASLAFFAHHAYSFVLKRMKETERVPNISAMIMFPFMRIFPMHLTIIFGGFLSMLFGYNILVIGLFLCLKTAFDMLMHGVQHIQWEVFARQLASRYTIPSKQQKASINDDVSSV